MKLLKDPLTQFLLLGFALWFIYNLTAPAADEFVITVPTSLEGQARDDFIRRQVLLREARRFGLDRNDSIVERQLQQKMRLLLEAGAPAEVSDEDLKAWVKQNQESYLSPATVSVDYKLFRRSVYGNNAEKAARNFYSGSNQSDLETLTNQSHRQLRKQLGKTAADAISATEVGDWQQPLSSGLGWLVFRVKQRSEAKPAPFEQIEKRARVDWIAAQEEQAFEEGLSTLKQRYDIDE